MRSKKCLVNGWNAPYVSRGSFFRSERPFSSDKKLPTFASKFRRFPFPFFFSIFFSPASFDRTRTRFHERAQIIARSGRSRFSTPLSSVFYSPVIFEENSTPERLISDPDTRCAYYEPGESSRPSIFFSCSAATRGETLSRCATFAASVRFQTPSALAVPLSKHNTTTAC